MPASEHHIVVPYRKVRGGMVPGEMRQSSNPESARRLATSMASRYEAVAAYSVWVDKETGDMTSPALLIGHGPIPQLTTD